MEIIEEPRWVRGFKIILPGERRAIQVAKVDGILVGGNFHYEEISPIHYKEDYEGVEAFYAGFVGDIFLIQTEDFVADTSGEAFVTVVDDTINAIREINREEAMRLFKKDLFGK